MTATWTKPRTWVNGEVESSSVFNNHVTEELGYLYQMVQGGLITITPSAAGTPTALEVVFPRPFPIEPYVFISYHGNACGNGATHVRGVGAHAETLAGFTATVTRNNTTPAELVWMAVLPWGMV